MKVRENQTSFICIANNFLKFDMYYLLKGIRLSVLKTKDINIGGNGLTDINFANLGTQVKFVETMKYYLASLVQLSSTLNKNEKKNVEKITLQFLNQHEYFSKIWLTLNDKKDKKYLTPL